MKKYLVFGMVSAIALSFTACSSEDELVANNPTFDGNSVKVEFALNLPSKVATRQKTAVTQDGADFRGINELYIAPYAAARQADNAPINFVAANIGTATKVGDVTLGAINAFDHTNAQDKWYNDITVPVGTNAFLVFAKPTVNGTDAENGKLTMSAADPFANLVTLKFELAPIDAEYDIEEAGDDITNALNDLANTQGRPSPDLLSREIAWSQVPPESNQYYAELFQNFSSLKTGSAFDVKYYLEKQLKPAIEAVQNCDLAEKLLAAVDVAIAAIPAEFPKAGIPAGAAVLKWETGAFSYVTTDFITGAKWGANAFTYPAELWYTANTGIRVDNEIKSNQVGTQDWASFIGSAYTSTNNMVKASTQSVALVNPLQYGVANLETQIKFKAENLVVTKTVVTDYTTDPATTTEEEVESVPVAQLTLSGILVGDQKNVNWKFQPVADDPAVVVYDTDLIATAFNADAYTVASQTLVLETAETQEFVNVALEFINNTGKEFSGVDGIVPAGAKFYLIGKLDISESGKNWTEETSGNKKLIFQQDFKTIAKFLINNLNKTAYNTIPDLRAPKLELGLSVDLEWQKGYTFDVTVGE